MSTVNETSRAFYWVVGNLVKSAELAGEISTAPEEQAKGIEQISEAVSGMDRVVQQNAANIEEAASASEELKCAGRAD